MPTSQADRLADQVMKLWAEFELALHSDKRKYPVRQFQAFYSAARRYAESTKADSLIHKSVVGEVHGLVDYLRLERQRVPDGVLWDAERLECLVFMGYDPHFEGDEPPGL
jgi:hypothetical protein